MSAEGFLMRVALRGSKKTDYRDVYRVIVEEEELIEKAIGFLADDESKNIVCEIIDNIMSGKCRTSDEKIESEMNGLINKLKEAGQSSGFELDLPACSVISDIWEIPLFFKNIIQNGIVKARFDENGKANYLLSNVIKEGVSESIKKTKYKIDRVVAISGALYKFSNVDLVKDVGMIPYLFHELYGCEVKMVTYKGDETYPYLKLLPGMQMELIEDDPPESMLRYICDNSENIDLLIIHGAFEYNHDVVVEYKKRNPDGKIFLHLDQNSEWMDRIIWDDPDYIEMMEKIDVKGSSCKSMQVHLNEKWPWHIECIRQGFYNVFGFDDDIDEVLRNKEKTILCAARHGTWQKATGVLLEAFAMIEDDISEWKLELAGSVEESFEEYIDEYYNKYPKLKSRVVFLGNISDRKQLHEHYIKAGIFALTSRIEGGTPNVISEALYSGCAIAITMFDAYLDAIGPLEENDRICGKASTIDDVEGYASILKELCLSDRLGVYQKNARWRAEEYFDAVKIERYLYGKLCG